MSVGGGASLQYRSSKSSNLTLGRPFWKLSYCFRLELASLWHHGMNMSVSFERLPQQLDLFLFVLFSQYSNKETGLIEINLTRHLGVRRWVSSQLVPAFWSAGDPRIGRHGQSPKQLTGPRPVP